MPTVKTENYPAEVVREMVEKYTAAGRGMTKADHVARAEVVEKLALQFGKSKRSIRSRLVREPDVYIKVEEVSKVTGAKPEKKEDTATRIVLAVGTINEKGATLSADSLAKMNKTELAFFADYFEAINESEAEEEADYLESLEADVMELAEAEAEEEEIAITTG